MTNAAMAYDTHGENGTAYMDSLSGLYQANITAPVRLWSNTTRRAIYPKRVLSGVEKLQYQLDSVGMPIALSVGIVTNILIVCTFLVTPVGRHPLSIYLTGIGLADLTYLLCCMVLWVSKHAFDMYNHIGMCQLTTYALFLSSFLATWYLVSAHLERCFWHFGPRRRKKWCTKFRSKCIIITISIFSMVAYLYALWTHIVMEIRPGVPQCMPMAESYRDIDRLRKVEIVFSAFIPMVLIFLMDMILLVKCAAKRCFGKSKAKTATRSVRMSTRVSAALESNGQDLSSESSSATMVCVICGILYIGLFMPQVFVRSKLFFTDDRRSPAYQLFPLFENFVNFNSIYKFFMYVSLLRSFRKGLVTLFTCSSRSRRNSGRSSCLCCEKQNTNGEDTDFV